MILGQLERKAKLIKKSVDSWYISRGKSLLKTTLFGFISLNSKAIGK